MRERREKRTKRTREERDEKEERERRYLISTTDGPQTSCQTSLSRFDPSSPRRMSPAFPPSHTSIAR